MLKFLEKRKVSLVYIPFILYWLVLFAATSFPTIKVPTTDISDKGYHFGAYFGLGVFLNLTLIFQTKYPVFKKKNSLYTLLIGSIYGILDEIHQYFIPGRSMEFLDFVADFSGLVLAILFVLFLIKSFKFTPK